jgi:hypothetical protein
MKLAEQFARKIKTIQLQEIVFFEDLPREWQKEAESNLGDLAGDARFFMPGKNQNPESHVLWDLTECMRVESKEMDGVIGISNGSALAVCLIDDETAITWLLG